MEAMRTLARFLVQCEGEAIPVTVRRQAARVLLEWLGRAIGACRHESVNRALVALRTGRTRSKASVLGRSERLDLFHAALINGMSSQVLTVDAAQWPSGNFGSGGVAAAIVALAEHRHVAGAAFLQAFALGMEAECRVGYAAHPSHHDVGWHPRGAAGVFGAAAACGRLLALGEQEMTWALGIAATQAAGVQEMLGAHARRFHPGHAARNGMAAALLAKGGFTPRGRSTNRKAGLTQSIVAVRNLDLTTRSLGASWNLVSNPDLEPEHASQVALQGDADLDDRFSDRVEPHLGSLPTRRLVEVVRHVEELADAGDIARASTPSLHWGTGVAPGACA